MRTNRLLYIVIIIVGLAAFCISTILAFMRPSNALRYHRDLCAATYRMYLHLSNGIHKGVYCNYALTNIGTISNVLGCGYSIQTAETSTIAKVYVFSPITPAGEVLSLVMCDPLKDIGSARFWLWSPYSYSDKSRLFVMTTGEIYEKNEDQVSWYYQSFRSNLSATQWERELLFRSHSGKPFWPDHGK